MWNSLFLLLVQCTLQYVIADGTYECGEHGKFEYCIDEIPGCVIGCHCHPGYYFDTDTKICEPNSNLLEHHRRHYVGEPTRVFQSYVTPSNVYDTEATTVNAINNHVNEMTKDADDLGDWLYNQFFKTIESQVVNNTNQKETLTRRSGPNLQMKKPKRTNKWRKGGKRHLKRGRNSKLKKKLLRITENDSLFDLSSSSSSDSSDSRSVSSDEYTKHTKYSKEDHDVHEDDNEHGHKKIVMINKKPKPPLPSFIFLPNLDTSFYPPIGLPPPPIVPMYPMVPVPPVIPLFSIPDNCETTSPSATNGVTTMAVTASITSDSTSDTTTPQAENNGEPTEAVNEETSVAETTKKVDTLRLKQRPKKKKESEQRNKNNQIKLGLSKMKPSGRQKILQRLKGKLKKPPQFVPYSKNNKNKIKMPFMNNEDDGEVPLLDNTIPVDFNNNDVQYNPLQEELSSIPDNVDFKYITELIHRVDLKNKSNNLLPPLEHNPLDGIEIYQPPKSNQNYYPYYDTPLNAFDKRRMNRQHEPQTDDSYYTNLGRQIATMIRGIDTQNEQVNIEVERSSDKLKNNPLFNQNSPQSFWERSVRSPLTFLNANKNKFEYLKRSNEILFNIENKVAIMASTEPTLSLQEIENMIKMMEAAKLDFQGKEFKDIIAGPSTKNLNIKLWPQDFKISDKMKKPEIYKKADSDNDNTHISNNDQERNAKGIRMSDIEKIITYHNPHTIKNNEHMRQFPKVKSTKKPSIGNTYFESVPLNYNQVRYGDINQRQVKASPVIKKPLAQSLLENEMNPLFLKHRKYFQGNNNIVLNQHGNLSPLQSFQTSMVGKPSYFRHEINHFDYF